MPTIVDDAGDLFDSFFRRDPDHNPKDDDGIEPPPEGVEPSSERLEATGKQYEGIDPSEVPDGERAFLLDDLTVIRDREMIPEEAETRGTEFPDWPMVLEYLDSGPGRVGLANGIFLIYENEYENGDLYYEIFVHYEEIPA